MWKAAFTGRSERGAGKGDDAASTSGRSERRRHRSGSEGQSVVSTASRRTDSDRKRRSEHSRNEPAVTYGAAPIVPKGGPPRSLTESAINAFNADVVDEGDWEDEDGKGAARSRRGDSRERRRKSSRSEKERSRSRDRDGTDRKRRETRSTISEKSRGKSRTEEVLDDRDGNSRAIPAMGSFDQFPGMYDAGVVGPPEHHMSGGLPYDPHVQSQFPGQNPGSYARPAFDPHPHGAAAEYYGDMGESVDHQPGVRANTPMMLHNPDAHLVTPSAIVQPAQDTGQGAAADYYGGAATSSSPQVTASSTKPIKPSRQSSGSSTTKATKKSSGTNSAAAVAATLAALEGRETSHSQHHSQQQTSASTSYYNQPAPSATPSAYASPLIANTNGSFRPVRHNSEPASVPGGGYYAAPPAVSGKPGKSSSPRTNHTGLYTAAGAAAAGVAAYEMKQHHDQHHTGRMDGASQYAESSFQPTASQYGRSSYGAPQSPYTSGAPSSHYPPTPSGMPMGMERRHEHRGPITRLKDGVLNLIANPDDVRRMEEYTEYIGVCKYCFDPRSSPSQGPRKHHYHAMKRDSFENLRRRSMERLRRRGSGESLRRANSKIDKESRYYSSDRKGASKSDLLAGGLVAAGAATAAGAMYNDRKDFDDTYSVRSGHRASSAYRRRSRSSSHERRRRATHGVIGGERRDEFVTVRTKDGRLEKRRVHRSRSRSADGRSGWMGAAAGAALGAGAVAAASSRRRDSSPERVFVRHAEHEHRSRSRSHSPGLGEIFGFTAPESRRSGRQSPGSSTYDISRQNRASASGGVLGGFFSPPEKKHKKEHRKQKKSGSFFTFSNGSSSSSNSELAFGDAFSSRSSLGRVPSTKKKASRKSSDEKLNATLLGIGATAAALAATQKGSKISKRNSRADLHSKRDGRSRRHDQRQSADEDEWEDELPSDDASSVDDGLAFGSSLSQRRLSRQSMESIGSQSSAGGLSAWDWRWGSKKQKRRPSSPPQQHYPDVPQPSIPGPIAASIAAGSALDAYGGPMPSESVMTGSNSMGQTPMQYVDPKPLSETGSRYSSMPGAFEDPPIVSRPGPGPIQQPQPIAPIQPAFTQAGFDDAMRPTADATRPRRSMSSPINGSGSTFMQEAALIGGAALATGSIIASQGRRSKEPGSVRFGFTEEQQKKADREVKRERDREDESRRKADRTRALKEEAERFAKEEDDRRARAARARELQEERELEAAAAPKRETEEEAMLRESRDREEAYRREQARFAEESRRRYDEQRAAEERAAREETERREQHEREMRAEDESRQREAAKQERLERESKASDRKGKSKSSDSSDRKSKKGERSRTSSTSSKSWQAPVAAGVAGALAGAVLDGALHKEARESKDNGDRRDSESRDGRASYYDDDDRHGREPYISQTVEPSDQKSGQPITDDELIDPDFFKRRRSASEVRRYEDLARKATEKVISEREDYYQKPSPSQKDFFMPKELLNRSPEGKERVADPVGDNDVRVYNVADEITGERFGEPPFDKGYGKSGSEVSAKSNVPRLNLIAPTPPHSVAGSVKGDRSIPHSPLAAAQDEHVDDDREATEARRPSSARNISWGEDTTHVYQVRTPDSYKEGDGYMASRDVPASAQTPLDETTAEIPRNSSDAAADLDDLLRGSANGDGSKGFYQRPFFDSVSDFTTVQTPGTEGAPPVRGWVEGETNEPTPIEEKVERMPGGFEDAVYEQVTKEGRPESVFTHHDSREIDPNAKVPGEEAAWEPPLSKKEKKKREKAAKRGETIDSEPTTPADAEPQPEPVPEPPLVPVQEEEALPLSKKEKKKREKAAKRVAAFDDSEPTTPSAERAEPVAEPIVEAREPEPEPEPAWEPPLSKKEQKKREKAAKKEFLEESEPTTPIAEQSGPEQDFVTPAAEAQSEPTWEPLLSKKEQKKRDKAAKKGLSFDDSEPATPTAERSEPEQEFVTPAAEAQAEPAWEPPLSKKELKKREKETKKQGFVDVAEALMTAGGVAAVVDAVAKPDEQDEWSSNSGKKSKKNKKKLGEPLEDDPRDIEPATPTDKGAAKGEQPNDMPGTQEDTPAPTPAAETPSASAGAQEPSAEDEWGGFESKKSKKKKKRDSSRFNEPAASSPLRSEVAFDDYLGGSKAGDETPYTNGHSKEEIGGKDQSKYFDDEKRVSESPRQTSPDDATRSVVSAPSDERPRSKSGRSRRESDYYDDEPYALDDTRSVAASEPAGVYDSKSAKRRSKHRDDDTASVTSSRSKRDEPESLSVKKEKKGGLFGLFSRNKSSEGLALSRTSTRDSKDGKDREDDEERRERRHRRKHTGSEYGDDDTRSAVSSSSRRHRREGDDRGEDSRERDRHRHRDSYDDADRSSRHGSGSRHRSHHEEDDPDRPRHHRRHRSGESASARSDKDQSFLGERVEELPPLPASRPASPAAAPATEEQAHGTPVSAAADDVDRAVSGEVPSQQEPETMDSQNVDMVEGENQALLPQSQSQSRPASPTEYFHQRPVPPARPVSTTAVPLRFRQPPSSPMTQRERASSFSSPVEVVAASPSSPSKAKPGRHEFRNSAEFRPLYLVSRNAKIEDVEEQLPSLPSSKPSSRASSIQGSEDWHSAAEDIPDSPIRTKSLKIDPEYANRYQSSEDVLGSQQTTPKAVEFEDPLTAKHYPRREPQFYTWDDYRQDERLHEAAAEPGEGSGSIDFSRPPLSQASTSASLEPSAMEDSALDGSPTHVSKKHRKKKMKGLAAAAMMGGGVGALLAHEDGEKQSEERKVESESDTATIISGPDEPSEQTWNESHQSETLPPASEDAPSKIETTEVAATDNAANTDDVWGDADVVDRPIVHREVPVEDRLPEKPGLSRKASKKTGKKGKKGASGSSSQVDDGATPSAEGSAPASFVEPEADFDDWFGSPNTNDQVTEEPASMEAAPVEPSTPATPQEVPSALFDRGSGSKSSKKKGKKGKKQSVSELSTETSAEVASNNESVTAPAAAEQDRKISTDQQEKAELGPAVETADKENTDQAPIGSSSEIQQPAKEAQGPNDQAPNVIDEPAAEVTQPAHALDAPQEATQEPAQNVTEDVFAPTLSRKQSKKSKKKQKNQATFEEPTAEPEVDANRAIDEPNKPTSDQNVQDTPFQQVEEITEPVATNNNANLEEQVQPSDTVTKIDQSTDDWSASTTGKKGKKGKKAKKQAADPWAETSNDQVTSVGNKRADALAPFQDAETTEKSRETGEAPQETTAGEPTSHEEGSASVPGTTDAMDTVTDDKVSREQDASAPASTIADEANRSASIDGEVEVTNATPHDGADVTELAQQQDPITNEEAATDEETKQHEPETEPAKEAPASRSWFPWSWGSKKAAPEEPKSEPAAPPTVEADQENDIPEAATAVAAGSALLGTAVARTATVTREAPEQPAVVHDSRAVEPVPLELTAPIEGESSVTPSEFIRTTDDAAPAPAESAMEPATAYGDQNAVPEDASKDTRPGTEPEMPNDQRSSTPEMLPNEPAAERTEQPSGAPAQEFVTAEEDFWAPATSKKKKGKKGNKAQQANEIITEPVIATELPAEATTLGTEVVDEESTQAPQDGDSKKPENVKSETPTEDADFWDSQISGKKKKGKKSRAAPVEEVEEPGSVEAPLEADNGPQATSTEGTAPEFPSGPEATELATPASLDGAQVEPAAEDFWAAPTSKRKGKKGKKASLAASEEPSTVEEQPAATNSTGDEFREAEVRPDNQPTEEAQETTGQTAPETVPEPKQDVPLASTEEDFWDVQPKGQKGKKGKKNKQAQAEEPAAPTETSATISSPQEATESRELQLPETQDPQAAPGGALQSTGEISSETVETSQEPPQEAQVDDLWAIPTKGKKDKKSKKGKRESDVADVATAEATPGDPMPGQSQNESQPADIDALGNENLEAPDNTSGPVAQQADTVEAGDNDDWASFETSKKGKKAKKARKAAAAAAEESMPNGTQQEIEPAPHQDSTAADGTRNNDDGAARTERMGEASSDPATEVFDSQDADVGTEASQQPSTTEHQITAAREESQESTDLIPATEPPGASTDPPSVPQELQVAGNAQSEQPEAKAITLEDPPAEVFNAQDSAREAGRTADAPPADDGEFFIPTKKSKKDKKKAKKAAAFAVDESPTNEDANAEEPRDDGMERIIDDQTDSAPAETTTIEQAGLDANGENPQTATDVTQPEQPGELEAMPTKKSKQDKKKTKKSALWETEVPSATSTEPLPASEESQQTGEQLEEPNASTEETRHATEIPPVVEETSNQEPGASIDVSDETLIDPLANDEITTEVAEASVPEVPLPAAPTYQLSVIDDNSADAKGTEQASDEPIVDPAVLTNEPPATEAVDPDTLATTSIRQDDTVLSEPAKKSKKDKKKAKKATAWDTEELPAETEPQQVTEHDIDAGPNVEPLADADDTPQLGADSQAVKEAKCPPSEPYLAEDDQVFSSKKSKKDKKKTKKAAEWDFEELAEAQNAEKADRDVGDAVAEEDTQQPAIEPFIAAAANTPGDQAVFAGAANTIAESNMVDAGADEIFSNKKSKKDKKKSKKAAALDTWEFEPAAKDQPQKDASHELSTNTTAKVEHDATLATNEHVPVALPADEPSGMSRDLIPTAGDAQFDSADAGPEAPREHSAEPSTFSTKKSKKDKKKAKKSTTFNVWDPEPEPAVAERPEIDLVDTPIDNAATLTAFETTTAPSADAPTTVPEVSADQALKDVESTTVDVNSGLLETAADAQGVVAEESETFATKKSKKDKKKAKNGQTSDPYTDMSLPQSTGVDDLSSTEVENAITSPSQDVIEPQSEIPQESTVEQIASTHLDNATHEPEPPTTEGFWASSTKKSKKDKKKSKKAKDIESDAPPDTQPGSVNSEEAPRVRALNESTPDDAQPMRGSATPTDNAAVEITDQTVEDASAQHSEPPAPIEDQDLGAFTSKKDKKEMKKAKKAQLGEPERPATGQTAEGAIASADGGVESGSPKIIGQDLIVDSATPPGTGDNIDQSRGPLATDVSMPQTTDEQTSDRSEDAPMTAGGDHGIDFAATLAAGLADSGFDPNLVVDDPDFHRRDSPTGQLAEADPEETFPDTTKKNKKSKRKGRKENEATTRDALDMDGPKEDEASNDFDATLAQGLQNTGFDAALLAGAAAAVGEAQGGGLNNNDDDAFFDLPKKNKKGMKGRKSVVDIDVAQPESNDETTAPSVEAPFNDAVAEPSTELAQAVKEPSPETYPTIESAKERALDPSDAPDTLATESANNPEAGEDEWALPTKKAKKGKKGKKLQESPSEPATQAETSEVDPGFGRQSNQHQEANIKLDDLEKSLDTLRDEDLVTSTDTKLPAEEPQDAGEDSWALLSKRKKGKKGKRSETRTDEDVAATASIPVPIASGATLSEERTTAANEDSGMQEPSGEAAEQSNIGELDGTESQDAPPADLIQSLAHPDAPTSIEAPSVDQPEANRDEQAPTNIMSTEPGEDDWAQTSKKKGKKSNKKAAAKDADPNLFPPSVQEPTFEAMAVRDPMPQAFEPIAQGGAERVGEAGLGGDGEMDVDEMDKAYKAYKKNKRKQKKLKGTTTTEDGTESDKPAEAQAILKSDEAAREAPPATSDVAASAPGAISNISESTVQQTALDASPSSPSRVQNLFPGLQRVKRRAPSASNSSNQTRSGVVTHTSEVSQHLPTTVEKSPSPRSLPNDDEETTPIEDAFQQSTGPSNETARSSDDVFAPRSDITRDVGELVFGATAAAAGLMPARNSATSEHAAPEDDARGLGIDNPASSWSFDALDANQQSASESRDLPSFRNTTSRGSLQGRRSTPPLHLSTPDSHPEKELNILRKREANEQQSSSGKHARTPSYETPLESTSRNRASYLFQSPPDGQDQTPGKQTAPPPRTPNNDSNYFNSRSIDKDIKSDNAPLSPPAGPMSPRTPLDTIPEENNAHKRNLAASAMAVTDRAGKSLRRTDTPKAIRDNPLSPVTNKQAANTQRSVSTPVNESVNTTSLPSEENRPSKRVVSDHRSPSAMSNRSNISLGHFKTPEDRRSVSGISNRSSTQSLRRVNMSGDLRAASRASTKRGSTEAGSAVGAKTIPFEPPPTPPLNEDEFDGASRATNMADYYQGYGDAQGSQPSPTRPPSVRKRQSMHIMELESKLDQLSSENQALQNARSGFSGQHVDGASLQQALEYRDLQLREKDNEIEQIRAMLQPMQQEIDRLMVINGGLSEANRNLVDDTNGRYMTLQAEHTNTQQRWQNTSRELESMREEHGKLTSGMRDAIAAQLSTAMAEKDHEIRKLREDLEVATERIRALQVQIQSSKGNDFLVYRDEDYFDGACQKLCQHVQQWVLRFSKTSDSRICRLSSDLKDEKLETRLDNALLDGSDVDKLLGDRVRRRDVFMSVVMTMVWEYVFTRYLFGMDREQRQKLKQLEKILSEVGPPRAVAQWRATTLTLLSKRPTFAKQCSLDTEAVAHEIFGMLCALLQPPSSSEAQLLTSLQKVISVAVELSIEMRTQRAEYIMLPPLQPEYDTNGDLVRKVTFNASLMNERSGAYSSNEELEAERAIVKVVLFPLVVKKGDESGEGEEEIVVCPAQVLVHPDGGKARKVVRVMSGAMEIDEKGRSRQSLISERPGSMQMF